MEQVNHKMSAKITHQSDRIANLEEQLRIQAEEMKKMQQVIARLQDASLAPSTTPERSPLATPTGATGASAETTGAPAENKEPYSRSGYDFITYASQKIRAQNNPRRFNY